MDSKKTRLLLETILRAYEERTSFELYLENRQSLERIASLLERDHGYRVTWHKERCQIHVDKVSGLEIELEAPIEERFQ